MKKIKTSLRLIVRMLAGFVSFIVLYLVFAFLLSRISIPKEPTTSPTNIGIYILSDDIHTDIVVPVRNTMIDWGKYISAESDTTARFVAFGWGNKDFYINTPTWAQLKFSTAFRAVFGLGSSAIHTSLYKTLQNENNSKLVLLTNAQYLLLAAFIKSSFKTGSAGNLIRIRTNVKYAEDDAFFDANGSYSLFYTCNTWANNALKACGQRACLWTVFANGISWQYR